MSEENKVLEPKLAEIIEKVEKLTIAEMADLVKGMEEKFGVSAAVGVAGPAAAAEEAEEKNSYDVILTDAGGQKIQVIKVIREVLGIGLKEAKDVADAAPKAVKEKATKAEADDLKAKLEAAGGKVELK